MLRPAPLLEYRVERGRRGRRIRVSGSICTGEQLAQQLNDQSGGRQVQLPSFARAAASSSGVGSLVDMMRSGIGSG
jgi:hypothetical protein